MRVYPFEKLSNPRYFSFGPDPFLSGEAAYETIIGVQSTGVQACAKHFVGNNQEHFRYGYTSNIDDRTAHELYLYPFLRSVEAGVSSIMCAYNRVNSTYACQNPQLLGDNSLIRKSGFRGYTVSDWGATHNSAQENANVRPVISSVYLSQLSIERLGHGDARLLDSHWWRRLW